MSAEKVKQYYTDKVAQEWRRLGRDAYHRLEFDTTVHFLGQYLPDQGHILDAGCGPGRYALHLARQGHDLTLLDLTPENLVSARRRFKRAKLQQQVRDVVEGSIVDLSCFADHSFDAVICTGGPLSHVLDAQDRAQAISELVRVARPGAPILVSVMSRLSVIVFILAQSWFEIDMPHFKEIRDSGNYSGDHGFTACHFFLPEELQEAFEGEDVTILKMAGLEGISSNQRRSLNRVAKDERLWPKWLETHYHTCTHPSVVGLSEHMLIICRKNAIA